MDAVVEELWEDVCVCDNERLCDEELLLDAECDRIRACDADASCEGVAVLEGLCGGDCSCVEDWLWDCEPLKEVL